jgi:hypothetical protein
MKLTRLQPLKDCLRDAARELAECPTVAVIQHESGEALSQFCAVRGPYSPSHEDVMQVAHHYFENGIAYFTRRINKTISLSKG